MAKDLRKAEAPDMEEAVAATVGTPAVPGQVVSFDRWFSTTGKPDHWKAGMHRFALTSGKKSLAAWAKLFENY